jgi:hypothetical protein
MLLRLKFGRPREIDRRPDVQAIRLQYLQMSQAEQDRRLAIAADRLVDRVLASDEEPERFDGLS